MKNKKSIG
jgi:serine/threonine protein kinase